MNEPKITQRAPFVLKNEAGTYFWCACGASQAQPFCDGSHRGSGFGPMKVDLQEGKMVAWCGCRRSKTQPFCDGSHSHL